MMKWRDMRCKEVIFGRSRSKNTTLAEAVCTMMIDDDDGDGDGDGDDDDGDAHSISNLTIFDRS